MVMQQTNDIVQVCRKGAREIQELFPGWRPPELFIQFGPGFCLDGLFDHSPTIVPLHSMTGLPDYETPDGVIPELQYGDVSGHAVLALSGHRHLSEANGVLPCILPVLSACLCGCSRVLLVSGGISLRQELKEGYWSLLTDFINWHHVSPLDGLAPLLPCAFPDLSMALSQGLNSEIVNSFIQVGIDPRLITFLSNPGFHTCTHAEADFMRMTGADMVGQDLAMEIIAVHAMQCQISALALAVGQLLPGQHKLFKRKEMLDTCSFCSPQLMRGLRKMLTCSVPDLG